MVSTKVTYGSIIKEDFGEGLDSELINEIKNNFYQINLGTETSSFQLKDEIFLLEKPTSVLHVNEVKCTCCGKGLKKELYCEFCGHKACDKCCYKTQ